MWEYELYNTVTNEHGITFGRGIDDAMRRDGKDWDAEKAKGWIVTLSTYVD